MHLDSLIYLHLDSAEGINVCAGNLVSSSRAFNSVASVINLEFHVAPGNFVQLPGTVLVATVFSYRLAYLYVVLISRHFPHYSFLPPTFTPRCLPPLIFFLSLLLWCSNKFCTRVVCRMSIILLFYLFILLCLLRVFSGLRFRLVIAQT